MREWADRPFAEPPAWRAWLLLVLALYVGLVSFGFGPYVTDDHAFRQSQTAISALFIRGIGDLWAYETPVLGPPWSVPFEFPLYQAIAKGLSVAAGLPLETAGRLVGVGAMLLCAWPLTRIVRLLGVAQPAMVLAPVFMAPLYVFWSRAFMIETTALLFALLYFDLLMRVLKSGAATPAQWVGLSVSGGLAALVKVTTLLPLFLVAVVGMVRLAWGLLRKRGELGLLAGLLLAHLAIAVPAGVWLSHADALKLANPLGAALTSKALAAWNFGPLAQRVDPQVWHSLFNNSVDMLFPLPPRLQTPQLALLAGWLGLFAFLTYRCDAVRRGQVALALGLFLVPFLIFTNLHRIHGYYQAANGVFLLLAFGLSAHGALERKVQGRFVLQAAYLLSLLALCGSSLWYLQVRGSRAEQLQAISAELRARTAQDDVVLISGQDWSPVIPYQAGRRALMIPRFATPEMLRASAQQMQASRSRLTALVHCGPEPDARVAQLLSELGRGVLEERWHADGCTLTRVGPA